VWRSAPSSLALVVLVCAACGTASSPRADQEWKANAHGAVVQLREDVVLAVAIDPEQALREESGMYGALVVFTDFGGCNHMIGALGSVPHGLARADAQLHVACTQLQRAAALFSSAVRRSSVELMDAAIDTAQRALVPLDRAGLALRGE
jgi:hypothetical protein